MKNLFPVLIVVLIIIGGIVYFNSRGSIPKTNQSPNNTQQTKKENSPKTNINILEEAFKNNSGIKCIYQDQSNNKFTTYIKGKKIFTKVQTENVTDNNMLLLEDKFYIWDSKRKTGVIMTININTSEFFKQNNQMIEDFKDINKLKTKIEKFNFDCKKENLADSFFQPAKDINFQDLTRFNFPQR